MKISIINWIWLVCLFPSSVFAVESSIRMDKMIIAGYSSSDIREILSGEKTVKRLNWEGKMRALGYSEQQIKERSVGKQRVAVLKEKEAKNVLKIMENEALMLIVREASIQYGLEFPFLKAVIRAESNFNPQAVSSKGAKGLTQLMPKTAQLMGVEDVFNPTQSIHGGAKYLALQIEKFGCKKLALAAYNAGPNAIKNRQIPHIEETKIFIRRVLNYEKQYSF